MIPTVHVIVNTGAGDAFQTGLDLAQLARDPEALREQSRRTKRFELRFTSWHNDVWKPVIAAVNGVCAGGGLHFVADADIVIASSNATFVDPHVSVGQATVFETIAPRQEVAHGDDDAPGVRRPARTVARAAGAYELGICSQVVDPPERLGEEAQALGELIARNSPAALARTKRALWGALERVCDVTVEIGTAIVSYIEPHPGQEVAFNRWYELDHFPATVKAGPGVFAAARFVATAMVQGVAPGCGPAVRRPRPRFVSRCRVGVARQAAGVGRVGRPRDGRRSRSRGPALPGPRSRAHRRLRVHLARGRRRRDRRARSRAVGCDRGRRRRRCAAPRICPWSVGLRLDRTIVSQADPPPHELALGFCTADPLAEFAAVSPPLDAVRVREPVPRDDSRNRYLRRRPLT